MGSKYIELWEAIEDISHRLEHLENVDNSVEVPTDTSEHVLVELVAKAIAEADGPEELAEYCTDEVTRAVYIKNARAAIQGVADWCEIRFESHGTNTMPSHLREQIDG